MKLLLDTHAILWILDGDERLSRTAREAYEDAENVWFSMASLWEIGIKAGLRRKDFQLSPDWAEVIPRALTAQGVRRLDVESAHCDAVSRLPLHHRDPFDRILVVQAMLLDAHLLSCDQRLDVYGVARLW